MAQGTDLTWWDVAGGYVTILIGLAAWALVLYWSRSIWRASRTWVHGERLILRCTDDVRAGQLLDLADMRGVVFMTVRVVAVNRIGGRSYAMGSRPWPRLARAAAAIAPMASVLLAGWLA